MSILYHPTAQESDIEALSIWTDRENYTASIEKASDDELRCWLIDLGYTERELSFMAENGVSLRDIADDMQAQGHVLS